MKKSLLIISLTPVMSVFAQTGTPAFVEGVPAQQPQTAAPQFQGQPGPAQQPQTAAPQFQGQPGPAQYPQTAAPQFQGQPGPAQHPHTAAPQFQGQPGPAQYPQTAAPQFQGQPGPAQYPQTAAPQFQGQPGPAQYPQTAAPQFQGQHHQSNPGAHLNDESDHDEIVGSVIGIDEDKQMIRIMTKKGPVSLKLTEDSELLIPGERPESLLDMDPNEFKKESKGRMVRIASRDGKIDHIEPAQD